MAKKSDEINKLHGSVKHYKNPTEPVIEDGWGAHNERCQNMGAFNKALHKFWDLLRNLVR